MPELAPLFPVNRRHFEALSDATGIVQHAVGSVPDPTHGYCTDDVARALTVDLLHARSLGWAAVEESAWRSLRFLADALEPGPGRFRNCRAVDGAWIAAAGSEDAQGRAMRALGEVVLEAPDAAMRALAAALFEHALPATRALTALRGRASALLGCDAAMRGGLDGETLRVHRELATGLWATFEAGAGAQEWPWPEDVLTYENALPAQALLVAGQRLGARIVRAGQRALDWLIGIQITPDGHLSPVGNGGWWPRGGARAQFDQQPIEATALLLAAEAAHAATGDDRYARTMESAYGWFLGQNDLGVRLADPERGACCDGLTRRGANENQGAESTLMWLIALERVRAARPASTRVAPVPGAGPRPRPGADGAVRPARD